MCACEANSPVTVCGCTCLVVTTLYGLLKCGMLLGHGVTVHGIHVHQLDEEDKSTEPCMKIEALLHTAPQH